MTADAPPPPPATFLDAVDAMDIAFDRGDLDRLGRYLAMLLDTNRQFNLTAVTDPETAWTRHIFDSLTLLPFIATTGATSIIDIGSGGGLPGIPLAIACPDVRITLLEATGKKARFLDEVVRALGLDHVTVLNERAETAAHDRDMHRAMYDLVIARAVGPLPVLLELTVPFAKEHGYVLAIKGERAPDEIEQSRDALHRLHSHVTDTHETPTSTIVIIEKMRKTPRIYPRRPGEPKRSPLGVGARKRANRDRSS